MERDPLERLSPEIERINRGLTEIFEKDESLLSEIGLYNLRGGGKRLRPLLVQLTAKALGKETDEETLRLSLVFELIHMATLLHDDIVDDSDLRRGRKAAHLRYGAGETVLAGDYLLAKSSALAMEADNMGILRLLTNALEELSLGELYQLKAAYKPNLSEDDYYEIIRRKTAVLLTASSKAGALLAGASEKELGAVGSYGLYFGLSFQIMDDVLDYEANPKTLGKPILKDLGEGRITLPFIIAMRSLSKKKAERLASIVENREENLTAQEKEEILSLVLSGGGTVASRLIAKNNALKAAEVLKEGLPPSEARETLADLAMMSADRER